MKNIFSILVVTAALSILTGCETIPTPRNGDGVVVTDDEVWTEEPRSSTRDVLDIINVGMDLWNIFK